MAFKVKSLVPLINLDGLLTGTGELRRDDVAAIWPAYPEVLVEG